VPKHEKCELPAVSKMPVEIESRSRKVIRLQFEAIMSKLLNVRQFYMKYG